MGTFTFKGERPLWMVMNELNVTFTLNPAWLAVGAGLLAVLVLGFLYSRWPRWKERQKRARSSAVSTGNGKVIG